jgi:hypothetical protein
MRGSRFTEFWLITEILDSKSRRFFKITEKGFVTDRRVIPSEAPSIMGFTIVGADIHGG